MPGNHPFRIGYHGLNPSMMIPVLKMWNPTKTSTQYEVDYRGHPMERQFTAKTIHTVTLGPRPDMTTYEMKEIFTGSSVQTILFDRVKNIGDVIPESWLDEDWKEELHNHILAMGKAIVTRAALYSA